PESRSFLKSLLDHPESPGESVDTIVTHLGDFCQSGVSPLIQPVFFLALEQWARTPGLLAAVATDARVGIRLRLYAFGLLAKDPRGLDYHLAEEFMTAVQDRITEIVDSPDALYFVDDLVTSPLADKEMSVYCNALLLWCQNRFSSRYLIEPDRLLTYIGNSARSRLVHGWDNANSQLEFGSRLIAGGTGR